VSDRVYGRRFGGQGTDAPVSQSLGRFIGTYAVNGPFEHQLLGVVGVAREQHPPVALLD
jgi:hypothetical protein